MRNRFWLDVYIAALLIFGIGVTGYSIFTIFEAIDLMVARIPS